jgi:DNA-binding NarL/FixJ family response regulator
MFSKVDLRSPEETEGYRVSQQICAPQDYTANNLVAHPTNDVGGKSRRQLPAADVEDAWGARVVITDRSMPPRDGIELTRQLRVARPETQTVALSFHEDANLVRYAGSGRRPMSSTTLRSRICRTRSGQSRSDGRIARSMSASPKSASLLQGDRVANTRSPAKPAGAGLNMTGNRRFRRSRSRILRRPPA